MAAGVAWQRAKDGVEWACTLSTSALNLPASAVAGEFVAMRLAMVGFSLKDSAARSLNCVVADCNVVISSFHKRAEFDGYRSKFDVVWRGVDTESVDICEKVNAHRTREEAANDDDLLRWEGNDKADFWAKKALPEIDTQAVSEYAKNVLQGVKDASLLGCYLDEAVKGSLKEVFAKENGVYTVKKLRMHVKAAKIPRETHAFCRGEGVGVDGWICIKCGARTTRRLDHVHWACPGSDASLAAIHRTHRMHQGVVRNRFGDHRIYFCAVCAGYKVCRAESLKHPCTACPKAAFKWICELRKHPVQPHDPIEEITRMNGWRLLEGGVFVEHRLLPQDGLAGRVEPRQAGLIGPAGRVELGQGEQESEGKSECMAALVRLEEAETWHQSEFAQADGQSGGENVLDESEDWHGNAIVAEHAGCEAASLPVDDEDDPLGLGCDLD